MEFLITLLSVITVITGVLVILSNFASTEVLEKPLGTKKRGVFMIIVGILIGFINGAFFYNPAGTVTAVQYLWGGDAIVTTQGIKPQLWGRTIPISYEIAIQEHIEDEIDEEEGIYYKKSSLREFSDAIKANIATSLIVGVDYSDPDLFLNMADRNKSEAKLVSARIIPIYEQALKNTCKLLDAQEYISGAASQFDYYLKDQLEHGMYLTEEAEQESIKTEVIGDTSVNRTVIAGGLTERSNESQKRYVIREDSNGNPLRDESTSLKRYGLTVLTAAVTAIDWEESFDTRLQLQKEQVAQTQLEKAEAEKEFYATQKAIAKGEREKAETKIKFEKIQIEETVAADTKAKAAKFKLEEEENLLAAAKKESERIRVLADAEAYKNQRLVSAGLTPQERAEYELKQVDVVSKNLATMNVPENMINSGGNGNNPTESLIQVAMMKQILGKK